MTAPATTETPGGDLAALAKGGRQNLVGFVLRLVARLPFLFIAGRLYGPDALGRFVSALVVIEVVAMICTIGEKRGLAQRLTEAGEEDPAQLVADGMVAALGVGLVAALLLWLVPQPMFPSGVYTEVDRLLVLAIPMLALTEIMLAAQAYRFDIAATVRARSVVEPWTLSIMAGVMFWIAPEDGLSLAYLASVFAAFLTAAWPFFRTYGRPRGWYPTRPRMKRLWARGLPLAAIDTIEWGTRRLDVAILGLFVSPTAVGVYYVAQQVASLPQKLKTSFEPILGPVLTRKLAEKDYAAIAKQVCQVGFWITAAQAGIGLTLGIPGEAVMALAGANFIGGTGALGLLLAAEVVAATAVVSEAALVYVARLRNLWVSIATIALQALLTVAAMMAIERFDLNENYRAAGAAGALVLALAFASVVKGWMLSRILGHRINNWRWSLVVAAAAAVVVGQVVILFPDWFQLTIGAVMIFGTYAFIIWTRGFGPEDRMLFTRKLTAEEPPEDPEPAIDSRGQRG